MMSSANPSGTNAALAKVVAWFDREGGRTAGTVGRIARASAATKSGRKQMDCIDLTANVTELLIVLEPNKMLKFNQVGEPVSRGLFVDGKQPHTTAVILENKSGTEWSVDFLDQGLWPESGDHDHHRVEVEELTVAN